MRVMIRRNGKVYFAKTKTTVDVIATPNSVLGKQRRAVSSRNYNQGVV
jgi:hypothetical protein